MHSYGFSGLVIRSELPVPELFTKIGRADVVIRLGNTQRVPETDAAAAGRFQATADETALAYGGVGVFQVRAGREIIITPAPGVAERTLRLFLLGPALAVLLHQRGRLILHASAVTVDGLTVAFLGGSGWGKSTTAAALYMRGHPVFADDTVAVDVRDGDCPLVYPGVPQLKLWPDVVRILGERPETLPTLRPDLEKRAYPVRLDVPLRPYELKRVYVLAEGTEQKIEPLGYGKAVVELIRHTYGVRLLSGINPRAHLLQCAALARLVPLSRLKRPRKLGALPALARCVEEDLAQPSVERRCRRVG